MSSKKIGQKQPRDTKTGRFTSNTDAPPSPTQPTVSFSSPTFDALPMSDTQVIPEKPTSPPPKTEQEETPAPKREITVISDEYADLVPLGTHIPNLLAGKDNYQEKEFVFPAAISRNHYHIFDFDKKELTDHIELALKYGSSALGKDLGSRYKHLTRKEENNIFKDVIEVLNWLTSAIIQYEDKKGGIKGYSVRKNRAYALNNLLAVKRAEARDNLIIKGDGIPGLPVWSLDGNLNQFWNFNDFEILSAVYRAEVEIFLGQLADAHNFEVIKEVKSERMERKPVTVTNTRIEKEEEAESISQAGSGFKPSHRGKFYGYSASASSSGKRFKDMFGTNKSEKDIPPHMPGPEDSDRKGDSSETPKAPKKPEDQDRRKQRNRGGQPPDSDPSDSEDDSNDHGRRRRPLPPDPNNPKTKNNMVETANTIRAPEFDNRLKVDIIPTWDGNIDDLGRWMLKINRLSERSPTVFQQLGVLVPTRLSGTADTWYYSLGVDTRQRIEQDWGTLREAIGNYFMNRSYINKQKARANKASFRDYANPKESPSEYYIRKLELLELVYDYTDMETINEIMNGAPSYWVSILTPHLYTTLEEFQLAIKFHEENLVRGGQLYSNNPYRSSNTRDNNRNPFNSYKEAKANLVGWSARTTNPPFPKDDSNISPRGTPVSKGGRPCRHCGSDNHWDPECKYACKGEKRARVNVATTEPDDIRAQEEYDKLYYEGVSDDEQEPSDFQ